MLSRGPRRAMSQRKSRRRDLSRVSEMGHPYPRKLEPMMVHNEKRFMVFRSVCPHGIGRANCGKIVLLTSVMESTAENQSELSGAESKSNGRTGISGVEPRRRIVAVNRSKWIAFALWSCFRCSVTPRPVRPSRLQQSTQRVADGFSLVLFGIPRRRCHL